MTILYSNIVSLDSFEERFDLLQNQMNKKLIGDQTFGGLRHLNQIFYRSKEWRNIRSHVIVRDNSCDLAFPTRPIIGKVYVHHITPVSLEDLIHNSGFVIDPENLITVSLDTHNALHYGGRPIMYSEHVERKKDDTKLW